MVNIIVILCCRAMVIVGFWAEAELNRNLANFISNSSASDTDAYFRAEQARYRILLAIDEFTT